jgi:adenine phosphoribosyltransferase
VDFVDYTGQSKSLELRAGAVQPGAKILLVDEWIETGAQVKAAAQLIEQQGGKVAGIASISIDVNGKTRSLLETYHCHAVWME